MVITSLVSFILIGFLTKLPFGLLGVSWNVNDWKKAIKNKNVWFFIFQFLRASVVAIYVFVMLDVFLVEHTIQSYISHFLLFVLLVLFVKSLIDYGIKFDEIPMSRSILFVIPIIIFIVYVAFAFIYPFTIMSDKYNAIKVDVKSKQQSVTDIKHMITVTESIASNKGDNVVSNLKNPSYFNEGAYNLTNLNGEVVYTSPIEFDSFWKYGKAQYTPGYITIDAKNPTALGKLTKENFYYNNSSYFNKNMKRVVRKAFPSKVIFGDYIDVDNKNKSYHIVSVGHYAKFRNLPIVDGVVVVDPTNGHTDYYRKGKEPNWIDRVIPKDTALEYWKYFGRYKHGWKNQSTIGSMTDVIVPTKDTLQVIVNNKDEVLYVSDFVREKKDGSKSANAVGYGVFNAKTGKMTYYKVENFITEKEAVKNVNSSDVLSRYRGWHGTFATYYNIYNSRAYVVPVVNKNEKFSGIAIASGNSNNPFVVFGRNKDEAFRNYKNTLAVVGRGNGDPTNEAKTIESIGVVERINQVISAGDGSFYIKLVGINTLFNVDPKGFPNVVVTNVGDKVKIEALDTGENLLSVSNFENEELK
jgi:hypothetical protein